MASNSRELALRAVEEDVPDPHSEWGWNGGFPRGGLVAGVVTIIVLLAMIVGNHEGHTPWLYLVGFAAAIALGLALSIRHRRNIWRR
ncbi:MAG: DUF2631 domain-containing protein [Pseudonocardia sp.]|nr:DUF2631 domain-containing protein [Pseudonocardia sp.]